MGRRSLESSAGFAFFYGLIRGVAGSFSSRGAVSPRSGCDRRLLRVSKQWRGSLALLFLGSTGKHSATDKVWIGNAGKSRRGTGGSEVEGVKCRPMEI